MQFKPGLLRRGGLGLDVAAKAEGVGFAAHGFDAEGDVLFERYADLFGAFGDVFAANAAGERFVLHAFLDGTCFQIQNTFRWSHVRAGGNEAGEFVAGEQRFLQRCIACDASVIGVGEDGADDFIGVATLAQDFCAFGWMFAVGGVVVIGPAFVIEIVEKSGEAPGFFISAVFASVGANARFDGEHMFLKRFRLGEFAEQGPGFFSGRHKSLPGKAIV